MRISALLFLLCFGRFLGIDCDSYILILLSYLWDPIIPWFSGGDGACRVGHGLDPVNCFFPQGFGGVVFEANKSLESELQISIGKHFPQVQVGGCQKDGFLFEPCHRLATFDRGYQKGPLVLSFLTGCNGGGSRRYDLSAFGAGSGQAPWAFGAAGRDRHHQGRGLIKDGLFWAPCAALCRLVPPFEVFKGIPKAGL